MTTSIKLIIITSCVKYNSISTTNTLRTCSSTSSECWVIWFVNIPTGFNGEMIENDSSFKKQKTDKYGIIKDVTRRYKNDLNKKQILNIKKNTFKIFKKLEKNSIKL